MRPESKKLLFDIYQAGILIERFVEEKTFDNFAEDELLQTGVERKFKIIGEAINQLSQSDPEVVQHISEYRRILSFRNILIHGYTQVDNHIVWDFIQTKLPNLHKEVQTLLDRPE